MTAADDDCPDYPPDDLQIGGYINGEPMTTDEFDQAMRPSDERLAVIDTVAEAIEANIRWATSDRVLLTPLDARVLAETVVEALAAKGYIRASDT